MSSWSRKSKDHLELGRYGEWRARWFYRLRGYRIVDRNVVLGRGEVDLIVRRGSTLVFAEVKTRMSTDHGEPWQAVDHRKRRKLIELARRYVAIHPSKPARLRFDVISISRSGGSWKLVHYPDAFRPESDAERPWILH